MKNMNGLGKFSFTLVLSLIMCLGLFSVTAFAADMSQWEGDYALYADVSAGDTGGDAQGGGSQDAQQGETQDSASQDGNTQQGESQNDVNQEGGTQQGESQTGTSQGGDTQQGENQTGANQGSDTQQGGNQAGTSQDGNTQQGENQTGVNQEGNTQQGENQTGANQGGNTQQGENQTGVNPVTEEIPDVTGPVSVNTYNELKNAVTNASTNPTTIIIAQTFDLAGYLQIKADQEITLTANEGVALERSDTAKGCLWVNGKLTLTDITLDGKNVPSPYALVHIVGTGDVEIGESVEIRNGYNDYSASQYGGGVYNAGTLTMNGGAISGNTAKSYGGGVYNKGTFTMNGGEISGNKNPTWYGGGVYNGGTFTANGGSITGNEASNASYGYGGGVYNAGTLEVTDTTISGNTAAKYGGGVYNAGTLEVTDTTISENTATEYGGGVYSTNAINMNNATISNNVNGGLEIGGTSLDSSAGEFKLTNLTITGNTGNRPALFVYSLANWTISGCKIIDNDVKGNNVNVVDIKLTGPTSAQVEAASKSTRILSNCTIAGNKSTRATLNLNFSDNSGTTTITDCIISGNTGMYGGIYDATSAVVIINGKTRIEGNSGTTTGGIHNQSSSNGVGCLTIDGAVITGNSGGTTGGVYTAGKSFVFQSGAIYGNEKTGTGKSGGNDFYAISQYAVYSLIKASEMVDPNMADNYFSGLEYAWMGAPAGMETKAIANAGEIHLTAIPNVARVFAVIGEKEYETMQAAIDDATENDVIDVVLGRDGYGTSYTSEETFTINRPVTIKFNGQNILANGQKVFVVDKNGHLTLQGSAMIDGQITVKDSGALTMDGGIIPYTYSDGSVSKKDLIINVEEGGSFTINGTVPYVVHVNPLQVNLAEGTFITAGKDFDIAKVKVDSFKGIKVTLPEEVVQKFNNAKDYETVNDLLLIQGLQNTDLLARIVCEGITSSLVQVEVIDGNIVLHKEVMEQGVYLDSKNGRDDATGADVSVAVQTLDKAIEIAREKNVNIIYVVNEITVNDNLDGQGFTLMRHPTNIGHLLIATADLALSNITLDGASELGVTNGKSLIFVKNGTLTLGEGVVLQNNDVSNQVSFPWHCGGGVYVGNSATLVMNDGEIKNCSALRGGGVLVNGTFEFNNGKILDCNANFDSKQTSGDTNPTGNGGGVAVITNQSKMIMHNGMIKGNNAAQNGGGIALPTIDSATEAILKLELYGGVIEGNHAKATGGGIYVNAGNKAIIGYEINSDSKVYIINNIADSDVVVKSPFFTGGGIYVNGNRSNQFPNGVLQLYRVIVTENSAGLAGDGLAGCSTSRTKIYLTNGGAIYGNTNKDGKLSIDAYTDNMDHYSGGPSQFSHPEIEISPIMLGGGAYNWMYAESKTGVPLDRLSGERIISYYSDSTNDARDAANAEANVFITGNYGGLRGGGIGSNGDVIIGTAPMSEPTSISVEKQWADEGYQDKRPAYVDVQVLRSVKDGESEVYGTLRLSNEKDWKATLDNLPSTDSEGNAYTYSVQEVADFYLGEVVEGNNGSFIITNYPVGSLTVTKNVAGLPENIVTDKTFSFTLSSTLEGFEAQSFTLKDGESITVENLLPGEYTITEDAQGAQVEGYNFTSESIIRVTVLALQDNKIIFHNNYNEPELTSVRVNKEWVGDSESIRPEQVSVQLYRNGAAHGNPVALNAANSWSYLWDQLDALVTWTVGEVDVPEGYTSTVSQEGTTFTITNTYTPETPPTPDRPRPDRPTTPEEPPVDIPDPDVPLTPAPEEPPVIIEEPDVPLAEQPPEVDIPEVDVPLVSTPPATTIPDPDVPLADVPQTGDASVVWSLLAASAVFGLAVLNGRRKEEV